MKNKTIEKQKLTDFGFVKMSAYPAQSDLEEFQLSMYVLTDVALFIFNKEKNKFEVPRKIELSPTGLEKIRDCFKDSIMDKRYRLTEIKLATLLEMINNHPKQLSFKNAKNRVYVDFSLASKANQQVDVVEDKSRSTENTDSGSKRLSSEINKSIQGFLSNINTSLQNTKVNDNKSDDEEENQLSEQLQAELLQKEEQYYALLFSVRKVLDEVYRKGDYEEKRISLSRLCELSKIDNTVIKKIDALLLTAFVNRDDKEDLGKLFFKRTYSKDVDLAEIFPKKQLDLADKLKRVKVKTRSDLVSLLTNIVFELNQALCKTNQLFCPYTTLDKDTELNVQTSNMGSFINFAQQFVEAHIKANAELLILRQRIAKQLISFEENGYILYVPEVLMFRAENFAQDKSGIYFNELCSIKQEIENKTIVASRIESDLHQEIHLAKNKKIAMDEIELYLSHGIDFCELKKNFLATTKKYENIEKGTSSLSQLEFESIKKKSDYFKKALKCEQTRRQQTIKGFESFLDLNKIDEDIASQFIISLIDNLKNQITLYKSCDISVINFIKNLKFILQAHLTQENLEHIPFYGSQNKALILDSFDFINNVLGTTTINVKKNPGFFVRETKEIEHARIIEQLISVIAGVMQMLEVQVGEYPSNTSGAKCI